MYSMYDIQKRHVLSSHWNINKWAHIRFVCDIFTLITNDIYVGNHIFTLEIYELFDFNKWYYIFNVIITEKQNQYIFCNEVNVEFYDYKLKFYRNIFFYKIHSNDWKYKLIIFRHNGKCFYFDCQKLIGNSTLRLNRKIFYLNNLIIYIFLYELVYFVTNRKQL